MCVSVLHTHVYSVKYMLNTFLLNSELRLPSNPRSRIILCTFCIWVIPCQPIHFFADPSPILMKFGKLGGQQKKQIHTKFQLISTIFNGVRAL